MKDEFKKYIIKVTGNKEATAEKYCNMIESISDEYGIEIFSIKDVRDFMYKTKCIFLNDKFMRESVKWDHTNTAALNNYESFLYYYKLKQRKDINPDTYNGIYELEKETVKQYDFFFKENKNNIKKIDYKDADLVYLMTGIEFNKEDRVAFVEKSNLGNKQKEYLIKKIKEIYNNEYECKEIGITTATFKTFKVHEDKTNNTYKKLINIAIEVNRLANSVDDNEIINFVDIELKEAAKNNQLYGTNKGVFSIILHCLAPNVFPLINGKHGEGTDIYKKIHININKNININNYIENVKTIKEYRDNNFEWKNYRIIDEMNICKLEYAFVAANTSEKNYVEDFIKEKRWQHFFTEGDKSWKKTTEAVKSIQIGTLIAMKTFSNWTESKMTVIAIGKVTDNSQDGINLGVEWKKLEQPKQAEGFGLTGTIYIKKYEEENEKNKKLIDFVFDSKEIYLNERERLEKGEIQIMKKIKDSFNLNTILFGPPGTGKTYMAKRYAIAICQNIPISEVEKMNEVDIGKKYLDLIESGRIEFTTFHQSYSYEDFIEGIRPKIQSGENDKETNQGNIEYEVKPGIFKRICDRAREHQNEEKYVLIIDEINRGNISKIFGELITLIEKDKRYGNKEEIPISLPYSKEGERFSVPNNLYIIGTMNTADRSIALIDTALRRRFEFIEQSPDTNLLEDIIIKNKNKELNVKEMLDKINERIEILYDKEHLIGHAYFMTLKDKKGKDLEEELYSIFEKKIIPLLQEYFYDDYRKIQLILGDNNKVKEENKFIKEKDINIKDEMSRIFGNIDENEITVDTLYQINKDAIRRIDSYIEI